MTVSDDALARRLRWASQGTAYFARKLGELPDVDFDASSALPGWTRRHLVAHVGYNARALARLVDWAATGVENPMYASTQARDEEIDQGATLNTEALCALSEHAAAHLDVSWRDLPPDRWDAQVRTAQGRMVPAAETPWMRSREVWIHAVDLGNGASFADFPADFLDALLVDVTVMWQRKADGPPVILRPDDRDGEYRADIGDGAHHVIRGSTVDLARWATGRGARDIRADAGDLPAPARWL